MPLITPELKILFLETTLACNLHCKHCRQNKSSIGKDHKDLSFAQIKILIDQVLSFARPFIVLSGGEPLLREDIFQIAEYIKDRKLKVGLATNAVLINEFKSSQIKKSGIDIVSVSIDSIDENTHDSFRGSKGAFQAALKGINFLKKLNIPFQINTAATKQNAGKLDEIVEFSKKLGARALHVFVLVPVGCAKEISPDQILGPEECEELLLQIAHLQNKNVFDIRPTCAPFFTRIKDFNGQHLDKASGCLAGKSIIFVSAKGEVYPCGYFDYSLANIEDQDLKSIWQENKDLKLLRDPSKLKGKCGVCEYKVCCGGCRAKAFAKYGDFLAQDPVCSYLPAVYTTRAK
ncbi:MAG: radical SAM protein [Candidatus Gygaella obscura]|nr:radical SAM protein [Candidatus Gygaella obscura]